MQTTFAGGNGALQNISIGYCDVWGVCTVVNDETEEVIATVNPFRYRCYYYDSDTGMYYLQSRYYDPVIGRFINADDVSILGISETVSGYNLFAYCGNNPVIMIDVTGTAAINVIFAVVGAIVGWLLGDFVAKKLGYYSGWKYWSIRTGVVVGGAVIGLSLIHI